MSRILTRPDQHIPAYLVGLTRPISPEYFEQLCRKHRDLRLELTSTGELVVMPPASSETGIRNADLTFQLGNWTKQDGTGICFDSSAGFTLPNKAIRSPDASWIRRERWEGLPALKKRGFARICPDFTVEICSPTDRLQVLREKMLEYLANGASMGWLIDPRKQQVCVYRVDQDVLIFDDPETVSGDPLLSGFKLQMAELW